MLINLTPHSFEVYQEVQFLNLEQLNPTTWVADGVEGKPLVSLASSGSIRINTATLAWEPVEGIPAVRTVYGEVSGIPEGITSEDTLIVSLPAQSMAKTAKLNLANQMASPHKVVRLRSNTSTVLGCMGISFQ